MIFLSVLLAACAGNSADIRETAAGRAETEPGAETVDRETKQEEGAEVENYGGNEKIFYPPKKLETEDTPLTDGGEAGGGMFCSVG